MLLVLSLDNKVCARVYRGSAEVSCMLDERGFKHTIAQWYISLRGELVIADSIRYSMTIYQSYNNI